MEISFYNQWVSTGRPFAAGAEFYSVHGSSNTYKSLFLKGDNPYSREVLDTELQLIGSIPIPKAYEKINRASLPDFLQVEFDKLKDLIKEIAYKHAQLLRIPTNAERLEVAKQILSASSNRRIIFQRIDHFLETGKDLVQKKIETPASDFPSPDHELKLLQLGDELRRLRSSRSKLKTNKKRTLDYNIVIDRIAAIESEIKTLKNGAL